MKHVISMKTKKFVAPRMGKCGADDSLVYA